MRTATRGLVGILVVVHGLLHLIGAAVGLGWFAAAPLIEPISARLGAVWLGTGVLVVTAGVLLAVAARGWSIVAAVAAVASQAVIITAWSDAAAGTAANVLLLVAAAYGYAAEGPSSFRSEYRRRVATALAGPVVAGVVTDADLAHLPDPVAAYVRQSGAVGQPRVAHVRVRTHGRIRSGPAKPRMSFTAEQVNTYGPAPSRLFLMDATMRGLPVDVLHTFVGPRATMRARLCSILPVLDAASPEMARAETVTLFNDLCLFAPGALVDAPVEWRSVDDRRVVATYTNGAHAVTAQLVFNDRGELVDFVSDDRLTASPDGTRFTPQRWSTPVRDYRVIGSHRLAAAGEGRWHPPDQPAFAYIELEVDDLAYNEGSPVRAREPALVSGPR